LDYWSFSSRKHYLMKVSITEGEQVGGFLLIFSAQLAARLQLLETPERRDHLLTHLVAVAPALDDLQIGPPGRGLAAEVHGGSACWCAHRAAIRPEKSTQIRGKRGTTLSRKGYPATSKINDLSHVDPREL